MKKQNKKGVKVPIKSNKSSEEKIIYKRYLPHDSSDDSDDEAITKRKKIPGKNTGHNLSDDTSKTDIKIENDEVDMEKSDKIEMPTETILSDIKNRVRRLTVYNRMKKEKKKAKRQLKKLKKKEEELSGKKTREIPHTIESKREEDITMATEYDEDLEVEEARDAYSNYYSKKYEPKILITSSDIIHGKTMKFIKELSSLIPNSSAKWRHKCGLQKLITEAPSKGFTDVIVVNEDRRVPTGLLIIHLPDGPSALFRLSNVKICKDLRRNFRDFTGHRPEIILNNFKTKLGHVIARMLGALFHFEPEFKGRSVCTFHNQRDYIFFRHHRYEFKNTEKVRLRELGPRFTMRLEWLRKGAFDGDFEWTLKRHEMETSRRKFFL